MAKAAPTTAPETTNAAPAPKVPSKMELCKALYKEVFAKDYDLQGKSQRAVFIARAQSELGMTKNGANTYYQNISNAERGGELYKYNKYERKGKAAPKANADDENNTGLPPVAGTPAPKPAPTKAQVKAAEGQANKTGADISQRWQLKDPKGNVVNSFSSREKAKKASIQAGAGYTWSDRDEKKAS